MTEPDSGTRHAPAAARRQASLALAALALLLAGCGRKGALYLPPGEGGTTTPPAQPEAPSSTTVDHPEETL